MYQREMKENFDLALVDVTWNECTTGHAGVNGCLLMIGVE